MTGCIRKAIAGDRPLIESLRLAAYSSAREFTVVDAGAVAWDQYDDTDCIVVACDVSGAPLSTTRGGILSDRTTAESRLEARLDIADDAFPALLIGKGATAAPYRALGLHSALRYHLLRGVGGTAEIRSVLGLVYDSAPRTNTMRSAGYEFVGPIEHWYTDLSPRVPTFLAVLERERLAHALDYLRESSRRVLTDFPWQGPELALRVQRSAMPLRVS